MPLVLSLLIASVFGGKGGSGPMPTVHVAILDQDKDMLTGMLRSLPTQGDAAKHLRLHFVESREEGLRLVEKSQGLGFGRAAQEHDGNLLKGQTNAIELYENPAAAGIAEGGAAGGFPAGAGAIGSGRDSERAAPETAGN